MFLNIIILLIIMELLSILQEPLLFFYEVTLLSEYNVFRNNKFSFLFVYNLQNRSFIFLQ